MNTKRYLLCELGEKMILLGKQGESGALRIEFDCAPWIEEYPTATIKLFVFNKAHRQDDPILPVLGSEGTLRVWIVGEDETATSGHGVIELVLQDADTGTTLKSATGYTTVVKSPSAGIEAREAQAGYVRYDLDQSEILTEEQKAIARNNIGAGTGSGTGGGIAVETDPTVPSWAKQKTKPTYTAAEVGALPSTYTPPNQTAAQVGADPAGTAAQAIGEHNVQDDAHEDIRQLIEGLTNRLNALADSDDTTLDQLSEIVTYIKSNKSLIDQITTGKVSVSDIVDNLTTNVAGKPLSAAQGVKLKALIDAIVIPTSLPNPQPIVINGESYDGSKAVTMTIQAPEGGSDVEIDTTLTKSGQAADAAVVGEKLNELNEANDAQDEEIAKRAKDADLAAVAKSGSYEDLSEKPEIPTVPSSLKNPNKLKLTGAVKAEYDGSAEVSVEIPAGGSEYTLPVATSEVLGGVKAAEKTDSMTQEIGVDTDGKLWGEPGGGDLSVWLVETLAEGTIPAGTALYTFTDTSLSLFDIAQEWDAFCIQVYSAENNNWNVHATGNNSTTAFSNNQNGYYTTYGVFVSGKERNILYYYRFSAGGGNYFNSDAYRLTGGYGQFSASFPLGLLKISDQWSGLYIRNYGAATTVDANWRVMGVVRKEAK